MHVPQSLDYQRSKTSQMFLSSNKYFTLNSLLQKKGFPGMPLKINFTNVIGFFGSWVKNEVDELRNG